MPFVVAERTLSKPITADQVIASIRDGGWCADLYGVSHQGSLLAVDGHMLICFFRAPDAEAVRSTQRRLGAPADRVWSATLHGPAGAEPVTRRAPTDDDPLDSVILVRREFEAPVRFEDLESKEAERAWCFEAYRVRFLQSLLSIDRKHMLCCYSAPDAETVRTLQRDAGMKFEEIWRAELCRL